MQPTETAKKAPQYARLNCRVSAGIKREVERAALLLGQSVTDFAELALAEKARDVIDRHEKIVLSERDFARFVESLENPDPATPQLREAIAEYRRLQGERSGKALAALA
jgi:uncharacterized protein (DUF1778 family)